MTTMVSDLPSVLLEEIFLRLPLKYLRAVRLTCRSWNNLSQSGSFTNMYISRAGTREEESMMIAMINYNLCLMKVVDDLHPYIEIKHKPSFLKEQVKISQVFHCDGLLLCILKDKTDVVVLNPYRGETRWIKPRYSHRPDEWDRFSYALGYENKKTCRSVKLLRFIDYFYKTVPEEGFFRYEIYDFDSDSWTTLDVNPHWCIRNWELGITLKGNTYWPARERDFKDGFVDHLICFDFARERFGPLLPLPVSVRDHGYDCVTLSCVKEEKLAALFQQDELYYPYELEIWITTKIDVEMVSWSKFFRMCTGPNIWDRISTICEGYFIDEEKKVAMGFKEDDPEIFSIIGEAGYLRNFDIEVPVNENCQPRGCSYVPSLVQIKKPAKGKRKRQSSLEKRRFAQNMLRLEAFEKPV